MQDLEINNFHKAVKRNEQSKTHVLSFVSLKQFGKTRIESSLSEQHRLSIKKHNKNVKKNRFIVSRLIDVTCFYDEILEYFLNLLKIDYWFLITVHICLQNLVRIEDTKIIKIISSLLPLL